MQLVLVLFVCCVGALTASNDNDSFQNALARMEAMEQSQASIVGKLTAELAAAEKKVEELKDEFATLVDKVADVETTSQDTTRSRRDIQRDGNIAFTAYLSTTRDDIAENTTIVFDGVITNVGNAYDSTTGIFTAPVDGVYYFSFFIGQKDDQQLFAGLTKNGWHKVEAVAEGVKAGHDTQGENAATLVLTQGDQILVHHQTGRHGAHVEGDRTFRLSSFSGFLIYQVEHAITGLV